MDPRRHQQLEQLLLKLGLADLGRVQWSLLDLALTHSSASATANYEQLEFVGDAVLRLAAAEFLLETYGQAAVGDLAALRSVLVSDRILAEIARSYRLDKYIQMSASAAGDQAGFASRQADALEAVMGALYLSTHDLSLVTPWLLPHLAPLAERIRQDPARQNYKAALQEWSQGKWKELPDYRVEEASVRHGDRERFKAEVWLQGCCWGTGRGPSIKAAQQAAAQMAFERAQAMGADL
ncbi:MAG: ribonuclease III [Synechococcales cyanobacterium RM1_1_8]|nr:ribonuclease III [Synechococcales cyanobacterium RM1_1_8]